MKPKLFAGIVVTAILLLLAALAIPNFLPARFNSSGEPIAFKIRILDQEAGTPVPGAEAQIKFTRAIADAGGYCDIVQYYPAKGISGRSGKCSFSGTLRVSAPGFTVWEKELASLFGASYDYFNHGTQITHVVHLIR